MRRHRHNRVKSEPLIEKPSKSVTLRERLNSPWLVIAQYVFNILLVLLIAWLAGNQAQFIDYLNGAGEVREREAQRLEKEQTERADRSRELLCELIASLEADIGGKLERISRTANCDKGPLSPGASAPGDVNGAPSTESPSIGADRPRGDGERVAPGPGSASGSDPATPRTGGASPSRSSPPPEPSPAQPTAAPPPPDDTGNGGAGSTGGVLPTKPLDEVIQLCLEVVGCVI